VSWGKLKIFQLCRKRRAAGKKKEEGKKKRRYVSSNISYRPNTEKRSFGSIAVAFPRGDKDVKRREEGEKTREKGGRGKGQEEKKKPVLYVDAPCQPLCNEKRGGEREGINHEEER